MKKIYNEKRFKQAQQLDAKILQWGTIAGTDIDFSLDISQQYLILGEWKTKGSEIDTSRNEYGYFKDAQLKHIKTIVDCWNESPKRQHACFVHATHDSKPDEEIDITKLRIEWVYKEDKIYSQPKGWTLKEFIEKFAIENKITRITQHITTKL